MSVPGAIRLLPDGHPETGMGPSDLMKRENFTTDATSELIHTFYTSPDGRVTSGVWECSPAREEFERYGVDEFMTVLAGSVTITAKDGTAQTFRPGDSFVIGADFAGVWENTETLRKFWMIYEPPA
ncbi:MAG: cupin domain-containing protein [Pseudomonadota bacterium]